MPRLTPSQFQAELEALTSSSKVSHSPVTNSPTDENAHDPVINASVSGDNVKDSSNPELSTGTVSSNSETLDEHVKSAEGKYVALDFSSCVEFVSFFDDNISSGRVQLYDWQKEVLESLSNAKPTEQKPHKFALCACNGSGKDAFVIAPFVVWFAACKIKSLVIITSSSGVQLTSQTERYIRSLADKINTWTSTNLGGPIFKINQRFIECTLTGSQIRLFATDEEGKAEGYHPEPGCEMAIVVNESKSVEPHIHRALRRCTGFNYWLDVSSPGAPLGDFHRHFTNWPTTKRVDYTHCPHHSETERLEDLGELGETNAYYRSKWLALFTSQDTNALISFETIEKVRALTKAKQIEHKPSKVMRVGIDLAGGGDENAGISLDGNRIKNKLYFREKNTMITADRFHVWLLGIGLKPEKSEEYEIYIDDNGIGRGTTDRLASFGWTLRRIRNQSSATDKKMYLNLGAQNWYKAKSIFEHSVFILDELVDEELLKQLSSRYYKQQGTQGRLSLESKAEAKANGRPSPDRADALILALTGLNHEDFEVESKAKDGVEIVKASTKISADPASMEAFYEKKAYEEFEAKQSKAYNLKKRMHGSMSVLINQLNSRN